MVVSDAGNVGKVSQEAAPVDRTRKTLSGCRADRRETGGKAVHPAAAPLTNYQRAIEAELRRFHQHLPGRGGQKKACRPNQTTLHRAGYRRGGRLQLEILIQYRL